MKTKRLFLFVSVTALIVTLVLISLKAYYVAVALIVGTIILAYRDLWSLISKRKMPPVDERVRESSGKAVRNGFIFFTVATAFLMLFFFLHDIRNPLNIGLAIPISIIATFSLLYFAGITLNMMSLGGLALGVGLLVDNSIVVLENIFRHLRMRRASPLRAVAEAVNEVRPPIILATLAVMVSFVPLFFITGMMGPYMRPMALNVPLAMFMSLVVAFTVTPWLSYHVLKGKFPAA